MIPRNTSHTGPSLQPCSLKKKNSGSSALISLGANRLLGRVLCWSSTARHRPQDSNLSEGTAAIPETSACFWKHLNPFSQGDPCTLKELEAWAFPHTLCTWSCFVDKNTASALGSRASLHRKVPDTSPEPYGVWAACTGSRDVFN